MHTTFAEKAFDLFTDNIGVYLSTLYLSFEEEVSLLNIFLSPTATKGLLRNCD